MISGNKEVTTFQEWSEMLYGGVHSQQFAAKGAVAALGVVQFT